MSDFKKPERVSSDDLRRTHNLGTGAYLTVDGGNLIM
jgi:hypothetical protein